MRTSLESPTVGDRRRADLNSDDVSEWLGVAEQVTVKLGGRGGGEFRRWLRETVGVLTVADRAVIEEVVRLGAPIFTTNYDSLISSVAGITDVSWRDGAGVQVAVDAYRQKRSASPPNTDWRAVVHLHGYWKDPESVVLGIVSYEAVLNDPSAQAMLRALASTRSLVFVGCGAGMHDPNFAALREWLVKAWPDSERRHYRLVNDGELEAAAAQHRPEERIKLISYGASHSDLPGFLRGLVPTPHLPAPARVLRTGSLREVSLPARRLCFGREAMVSEIVTHCVTAHPRPVPILGPPVLARLRLLAPSPTIPMLRARSLAVVTGCAVTDP